MSKVSIIIPVYNCPYISFAIESALKQTYMDIEIIVVNDGSTVHQEKIAPYYSKVRYFEKENGGTASALNMGIQNATGDYFAWLSSDDMFIPEKVERQLVFMKNNNSSFTHTAWWNMNAEGKIIGDRVPRYYHNQLQLYKIFLKGCPINGCTVMMPMEVFSKVGLFDESCRFTQDYDFWLRTVQHYDVHYLDEPLVLYRVHPNMGSRKHTEEQNQEIIATQNRHREALLRLIGGR